MSVTRVQSASAAFPSRSSGAGGSSLATSAPPTKSVSDLMKPRPALLPPSAQDYSALVKVVLRRRLKHLLLLVAAAAFIALAGAVFDPKELPGSLFSTIVPALLFTPLALLGTLPPLILRKQTISTALPYPRTLFSQLLQLRQPSTLNIFLAYLSGAIPFLFAYVLASRSVSSESNLGILVYHKGRDAHMLNERWIYLSSANFTLAAYATVLHVFNNRSHVEFDASTNLSIPARLAAKFQSRLPYVVKNVTRFNGGFFVAYVLLRRPILHLVVKKVVGMWARPYLYALLRSNAAFSPTLLARTFASTAVTISVWEATHALFEVYVTQPVSVSHYTRNPQYCLLSGLRSPDPYYQHFAFLELARLSLTDSARRKAIFTELKPDGTAGGAWQEISRECLKITGQELQRVKGRGNIASSAPVYSSPSSASRHRSSHSSPVKNENVFQPAKKTFLDSILTPAPAAAPAPQGSSTAVSTSSSTATSRVPSIFQTSSSAPSPATASVPRSAVPASTLSLEEKISGYVPEGDLRKVLFGQSDHYRVGVCVANRRMVIWAVEALSNMLSASLHEDPYGVAQHDIPRVLEGFVLFLLALESSRANLGADQAVLDELVTPVENALKDGARAVLEEFSEYVDSFAFPPKIAAKLQLLVDWG